MFHAGDRIGPMRVTRQLGAGGMGEVYLAFDERLERLVAVKLLQTGRDAEMRGRMLREARSASALKHPNIVTVHDIGEHDGRAYLVMEFVEGETFESIVARRGALPAAEAIALVAQAASALTAAHAAGVLHRDVKSANLMLDQQGQVKVLDFGLSKRTGSGVSEPPALRAERPLADVDATAATIAPTSDDASAPTEVGPSSGARADEPHTELGARMGTPGWSPPELIDGRPADARTDVFSLGVVLYHLLTGTLPFPGRTWAEIHERILAGAAPPSRATPGLPPALDAIVLAALAPDPDRRPAGPDVLAAGARAAIAAPRRTRVPVAIAGVAVVAGVATIVLVTRGGSPRPPAAVDAGAPVPTAPRAATQLTRLDGCAFSPAFLDDDVVTFDLTRDGGVDLYRVSAAGSDPVRLTSGEAWEWRSWRGASDHEVLYVEESDSSQRAMRLDLSTGAATQLFSGAGGVVVYAGGAYYYGPANSPALRRVRDGRDESILTVPDGQWINSLAASPDGKRLAMMLASAAGVLRLCWTDLDQPTLVCSSADVDQGRPAWSADSRSLYASVAARLIRIDLEHDRATTVASGDAVGGLAIASSGRSLVYSTCGPRTRLFDVSADADHPLVEDDHITAPRAGPGGRVAFVRKGAGRQYELVLRDADGSLRTVYVGDGKITDLAFSPEGAPIVFVLGSLTAPGIYLTDTDSLPANPITDSAGDSRPLVLSSGILFTRHDRDGVPHLMKVGVDGSGLVAVGTRPRVTVAADPVHHRALLSSPGTDHLYWWDEDTGRETPGPIADRDLVTYLEIDLSPDGEWLMFLGGQNGQKIYRLHLDGTSRPELVHQLPLDLTSLHGTIDDRGHPLVVIDAWRGDLWKLDAPDDARW